MKYILALLTLSLCSACASRKAVKSEPIATIPGTTLSRKSMPQVRTPETVKAYPVGRYTDPQYPDEMHERHTVYRREQSPDWNYLPDPPYALPLGPTVANSNPSPSYYVKAEGEMTAQQEAYAAALQEQNRAMKNRIESMQQDANKVPGLEQEIDRLKRQLDQIPPKPATSKQPDPVDVIPSEEDLFSSVEPPLPVADEFTGESQEFLLSQMRLNDEVASELKSVEQRKLETLFHAPFLRRKELALLTKNIQ